MLSKTIISALAVLLLADKVTAFTECTYSDTKCKNLVSCERVFGDDDDDDSYSDLVFDRGSCSSYFNAIQASNEEYTHHDIPDDFSPPADYEEDDDYYTADAMMARFTSCQTEWTYHGRSDDEHTGSSYRGFCGAGDSSPANMAGATGNAAVEEAQQALQLAQAAFTNAGCSRQRRGTHVADCRKTCTSVQSLCTDVLDCSAFATCDATCDAMAKAAAEQLAAAADGDGSTGLGNGNGGDADDNDDNDDYDLDAQCAGLQIALTAAKQSVAAVGDGSSAVSVSASMAAAVVIVAALLF